MEDNTIFKLTEKQNLIIQSEINTMGEWIRSISRREFDGFYDICIKETQDRTFNEYYTISKHSLILYCRELDLYELSITEELITKIIKSFCINIIFQKLINDGLAKSTEEILIYRDCESKLLYYTKNYKKK